MAERAQSGVRIDNKRVRETPSVALTTPHGAEVVVTPSRARDLLNRPPLRFGDGVARKYVASGEDTTVEVPTVSKAAPPRVGSRANTEES